MDTLSDMAARDLACAQMSLARLDNYTGTNLTEVKPTSSTPHLHTHSQPMA